MKSGVVAAVFGTMVGGFMMYVAWQHNPQGSFHDYSGIHWVAWFTVGLPWFFAAFALVVVVIGTTFLLQKWID
jgi:hypothetical protein